MLCCHQRKRNLRCFVGKHGIFIVDEASSYDSLAVDGLETFLNLNFFLFSVDAKGSRRGISGALNDIF